MYESLIRTDPDADDRWVTVTLNRPLRMGDSMVRVLGINGQLIKVENDFVEIRVHESQMHRDDVRDYPAESGMPLLNYSECHGRAVANGIRPLSMPTAVIPFSNIAGMVTTPCPGLTTHGSGPVYEPGWVL